MQIKSRAFNQITVDALISAGENPLLARLYAARGVTHASELKTTLAHIIPPEQLTNNMQMAILLADAMLANKKILVIGDYDADGATATAVAVKGLRLFSNVLKSTSQIDFLVPNRFEYGYGLTPEIVALAATLSPDVLVTVDNGIASCDGVLAANQLDMQVLITDHHLPSDTKPQAACIVNPNQHGCDFKSKHLAGVGVMFYVLLALRAELRKRGIFDNQPEPNLSILLDLVALGTVADLVKLDANNRILVEQGLRRIRASACAAGITALLQVAGREPSKTSAQDLGFYVGPRLNAAGRLDDMRLGITCLLAEDAADAVQKAQTLHELNMERRNIEADMQDSALAILEDIAVSAQFSISLFNAEWHQGVIGILASRLKDRYHRPAIVFAEGGDGLLKGSGRSIASLHLRDALDLVTKIHPDLIVKFGGHAMAAGLTIRQADFLAFEAAFEAVVRSLITETDLQAVMETDGGLQSHEVNLQTAQLLAGKVWGQGFHQPLFFDDFAVINQRIVGEKHLKLILEKDQKRFDAIYFNQRDFLPDQISAAYVLEANEYKGLQTVQLQLKYAA
ncbi:MAG: single-stranded-DNA-specific exonuclease RecJ [Proteobacteria bacterium ST_bin12]|nr:MAG: single-stranded-DNA-specific exonuclease RecJ [Proteobacteria bacterium ST_bin12]